MIFGTPTDPTIAYCILHMGQSNGDGNGQGQRLANTLWNYRGLLQNWPATRTTEDQYSATPSGVHIYNKQNLSAGEWMADDGVWEPYTIGVSGNSRNRINIGGTQAAYFGHEAVLAQDIVNATGAEVFILKPAFPATPLYNAGTSSTGPGQWNFVCRTIAAQAYIERAIRDFAAYRPGVRLKIVNVSWWQGENDAGAGRTSAEYQADFADLLSMIQPVIAANFVLDQQPAWNLVALDFNRTAGEAIINDALQAICTTYGFNYVDAHVGKSTRRNELTAAQADPITKGVDNTTPNSVGGLDDQHTSYIGHQLVGQDCFLNIQTAGLIP
jgi:hypothetical protein